MPDNRRTSSPNIAPNYSCPAKHFQLADQDPRAVIRKVINSAIYVEKSVMPPLRKKSPIEIVGFGDSEPTSRSVPTDRSVKRCRCITTPQCCPCHPANQMSTKTVSSLNISQISSSSSSDMGSQITVKSKEDYSKQKQTDLNLSLSSLHSDKPTINDLKEKEQCIRSWLKKKVEEKKKKEEDEARLKEADEKSRQRLLEKERENFKNWLANKKLEEERIKIEKENEKSKHKLKEVEQEKRKVVSQSTYNQWLNRKKRAELERKIKEKLALLKILEEKQNRFEASQKAFNDWLMTSKSKPKPVPLNQGLKSLCSSTSVTYINPVPWKPNLEISQKH